MSKNNFNSGLFYKSCIVKKKEIYQKSTKYIE